LLLPFLVNRNEYYSLQEVIAKIDHMTPEEIKKFDAEQRIEVMERKRKEKLAKRARMKAFFKRKQ
jgi:hypothetical protein